MDPCDDECKSNSNILKCTYTSVEPYCGTYAFPSGTKLFGCRSYSGVSSQVLPLANYYSSELGPDYTTISVSTTSDLFPVDTSTIGSDETRGAGAGAQSTGTETTGKKPTSSSDADKDNNKNGKKKGSGGDGLSGGAIAGIVIGVVAIVAAFGAFLVWVFFIKKRKDNSANNQPPPTAPLMGGQQGAAGGYFAPEHKPTGSEPPLYTPEMQQHQQQQQYPQEISGTPVPTHLAPQGSAGEYYDHNRTGSAPSEMAATPASATAQPSSAAVSPGQMSATLHGPVQHDVYEMPGSRPGSR